MAGRVVTGALLESGDPRLTLRSTMLGLAGGKALTAPAHAAAS
ncbi:hypothetical protein [Streptomyces brevispora]|uniref:Uncharacterized protein n=1 Tax=Streptomyces brevispora TaxID=887462 RepID=A0ABZ1G9T8_9ACTN|nr:hypothetical protein [Streptomyces brevispora]WSC16669.1 hypothetical protein OIE64_30140 [Streptomyces brevispora]